MCALGVRVATTPILRSVDLRVGPGEAVGLVGANGSGKTTLLRVAATLVAPTSGAGRVLGAGLREPGRFGVRRRIGLIGHLPALYPDLSLLENSRFVARMVGAPPAAGDESLVRVGLSGARLRRAADCSHGMQRRAEFARLLITRPDLVLLDEAHAGLDRHAEALVALIVDEVRGRGGAALLVSHEQHRVEAVVDRVIPLEDGVVDDGCRP